MFLIRMLVIFLLSVRNFAYTDTNYYYYYDSVENEADYERNYDQTPSLKEKVEESLQSLKALFGTEDNVNSEVLNWIDDVTSFWKIEQAAYNLQQKLANQEKVGELSENQLVENTEILEMLNNETKILLQTTEEVFYSTVTEQRKELNCLMGRSTVNKEFAEIERCSLAYSCSICLFNLWKKISKHWDENSQCNRKKALEILILIDNFYKDKLPEVDEGRINFLYTITTPSHKKLLEWDEAHHQMLCFQPSQLELDYLSSDLELRYSDHYNFSSVWEVLELIELQRELAMIYAQNKKNDGYAEKMHTTNSMVSVYLKILDNAIGNKSGIWEKTIDDETNSELEKILFRNEDYIGVTFNIFHKHDHKEHEREYFNQTTLEFEMVEVQKKDKDSLIAFGFEDTEIWTSEAPPHSTVLAIHYKSWKENLLASQSYSKLFGKRSLVGNGGIVSISARINDKRKQLPVHYRIKFSEDDRTVRKSRSSKTQDYNMMKRNDEEKYYCFSCRYLDEENGEWKADGCKVEKVDDHGVTCNCDHATTFAVFKSSFTPNNYSTIQAQSVPQNWIEIMEISGTCLTILTLISTIMCFFVVKKSVRSVQIRVPHINLLVALLCFHVVQVASDCAILNNIGCLVVNILKYYLMLVTLTWLLVDGIFLYLHLVRISTNSHSNKGSVWMFLLGWGFPLTIVAIAAGVWIPLTLYVEEENNWNSRRNYCPKEELPFPLPPLDHRDGRYERCQLSSIFGMVWCVVGAASLILLSNFIFLGKIVQLLKESNNGKCKISEEAISKKSLSEDVGEDGIYEEKRNPTDSANSINSNGSQAQSQENLVDDTSTNITPSQIVNEVKPNILGDLSLILLLGISWILRIFGSNNFSLGIVSAVSNSIQGIGVFLIYWVLIKEIQR